MDTHFTEIDASDVQTCFPKFYDKRGRFFEIVHKGKPIGFVGIRPLRLRLSVSAVKAGGQIRSEQALDDHCEMEVFIFKQYRNTLTKGIVLAVLDLPRSFNFKWCWMKTTRKTVIKLLRSMKKYGVVPIGMLNHHRRVWDRQVCAHLFVADASVKECQ